MACFPARLKMETAVKLFVDVMLKKVLVVNKPAIAATCIYLACRIMQCPRVLEEIAIGTNIEASLIQRMQGEVLRGMQIVIRITKSADIFMRFAQRCLDRLQMKQFEILSMLSLKPLTAFPVIKEEKSSKQPLSLPNPHLPSFPCNTTPEYQMELQLPYLCLEEGMSLCERIAEYELLPENIPPQAVAAAVFVWLLLLLPDVTVKKLFLPTASNNQRNSDDAIGNNLELNKNWNTGDINNLTPNEKEQLLSRMLWPPVTLANIAEECYTSVSVVKNVMLRLYASMKVLLLLPASGTDESQTLSKSTSDTSFHKSSNGKNRNPPAQIHQRFAQAFENFQIALAVESAIQQVNSPANVASPPVSSTGGTKKRKRSLSTGQSIGIMQPSSASNGAGSQELALLLDKLLTGEGEEHFIRSPLWKELITIRPSSQSQPASTTVSRVSSTGKLPLQQDHPPENSSLLQNTPPCANIPLCYANDGHNNLSDPKSDTKYKQIQQLSQGLFMSGRKRFKSML